MGTRTPAQVKNYFYDNKKTIARHNDVQEKTTKTIAKAVKVADVQFLDVDSRFPHGAIKLTLRATKGLGLTGETEPEIAYGVGTGEVLEWGVGRRWLLRVENGALAPALPAFFRDACAALARRLPIPKFGSTQDERVCLLRQFRHAAGGWIT